MNIHAFQTPMENPAKPQKSPRKSPGDRRTAAIAGECLRASIVIASAPSLRNEC
jgi:hypothetical protein